MAIKIIWGVPGAGKTYYTVRKMLQAMKKKRKKLYFSNFPIYHKKYGWSYVWLPEYSKQTIVDAEIIIDEAYRNLNSREFQKFTKDEHTFFATCRHLNNDIWIIAHNPARIDVVIREITEEFILMHCHKIPILGWPIWFSADVYLDEQALAQRYTAKNAKYCVERFFFSKRVAKAYDTHFFRPNDIPEFKYESWGEKLGLITPNEPMKKDEEVNDVAETVTTQTNP